MRTKPIFLVFRNTESEWGQRVAKVGQGQDFGSLRSFSGGHIGMDSSVGLLWMDAGLQKGVGKWERQESGARIHSLTVWTEREPPAAGCLRKWHGAGHTYFLIFTRLCICLFYDVYVCICLP